MPCLAWTPVGFTSMPWPPVGAGVRVIRCDWAFVCRAVALGAVGDVVTARPGTATPAGAGGASDVYRPFGTVGTPVTY